MSSFKIVPTLEVIETFSEFIECFQVTSNDLILTDRYLYSQYLQKKNLTCILADDYGNGEPTQSKVNAIRADMAKHTFDRIIAIGGGTVIDIAKLMVLDEWTDCLPLFQKEIPAKKIKPLIVIPTTCGTGSEVTCISVVAFQSLHTKLGLAADALYADDAVLIPEFLEHLPFKVFMLSSIDALIHAIESYLSPKSNEFTRMFSENAIHTLLRGYAEMESNRGQPVPLRLKQSFLTASAYAGIAFSNAGCALIHAMSYPLSEEYHLVHGEANYQLMFAVLRFYAQKNNSDALMKLQNIFCEALPFTALGSNVYGGLENLIDLFIERRPMANFGMNEEKSAEFARQVEKNQQRLLANSYIAATTQDMIEIYNQIL